MDVLLRTFGKAVKSMLHFLLSIEERAICTKDIHPYRFIDAAKGHIPQKIPKRTLWLYT